MFKIFVNHPSASEGQRLTAVAASYIISQLSVLHLRQNICLSSATIVVHLWTVQCHGTSTLSSWHMSNDTEYSKEKITVQVPWLEMMSVELVPSVLPQHSKCRQTCQT